MSAIKLAKTAIKIPKRIERGPTDILKALASTVKHVPSEPDQLLQDDPYLLPIRPALRNIYSLSRLSGKNAAKFILNKHPELFHRDISEPKVRSFMPPEEYRDDMEFDENDLKWCIDNNDPINGIIAYNNLVKNKVALSNETILQFFELLCYTNEEKMLDQLDLERHYLLRETERQLVDQTWKTTGLVSKIFDQIKKDVDPVRVYSAMIAGLSKFNEHATAKQIFEDFKESHPDAPLCEEAYNGLLNSVPNLNSSVESAHQAVENIVQHMESHSVMPDVRIFNSILSTYKRFFCDEETVKRSLSLLNDMRAIGVEPSLFTYSSLFAILARNRGSKYTRETIGDLLDYICNNDSILYELRDDRDLEFLVTSMRIFTNQLYNLNYANKLHKIYLKRPTLFRHVAARGNYLNNYFRLIVTSGSIEDTINFYNNYAPMNFRPTEDNYEALNEALDLYR
jgi:pentatricopeptide repeat domain-containing protein 3